MILDVRPLPIAIDGRRIIDIRIGSRWMTLDSITAEQLCDAIKAAIHEGMATIVNTEEACERV